MDQHRALLFSDWNLEEIIQSLHSDHEDDFSNLVALVKHDKFDEASEWFRLETSHYPWVLLVSAFVNLRNGKKEEAAKLLRAVTLIAHDTIVQLWAWHNLVRLGKTPAASMSQQVLGIIIEVPYENKTEVLASYADGTARYITHNGAMILWEDYDETITPLIYDGLKMAHPMGKPVDQHKDSPLAEEDVRLTVLTPGGTYIWEGNPEDGSDIARLFTQQASLLRALVRLTLERNEDES